ncbi:MAG: hypothetical protein ACRELB_08330, partial [Polyangiaceae bacterium]
LPFSDGALAAVVDMGARRHAISPHAAAREVARALASGAALVMTEYVERESDHASFFNALEQLRRPAATARFGKAADATGPIEAAGLAIDSVAFFRERRAFRDMEVDAARGEAGPDLAPWRALLALASQDMRALYDIDADGMSWRRLAFIARKT